MSRAHSNAFRDAYVTGRVFTLRVPPRLRGERAIMIEARDATCKRGIGPYGHTPLDIIVRQGGKVVLETQVGIPSGQCIDGAYAKEAAMGAVAIKPGDTDAEFFASYTPEQMEWVKANGEHIDCERMARYCDENGNLRGGLR